MSSLKKNFAWNGILTISGYLFPLLTFPYVTRVLGAENFGIANFAMSIVDYAILFSTLGLATIGYRYIPQCNDDRESREDVFNHLVSLHIIMTGIILVIYTVCVFVIPQLSSNKPLYFIGATKIIFNIILVEWLFQGMQDFRFITLRTLLVRALYVVAVFLFVRKSSDYDIYFYLTIAQVVVNAVINWHYTRQFVSFRFQIKGCKKYLFPVLSMGVNRILFSFYLTFNVIYLGMLCGNLAVGYFSTATRLYTIFLSILNAYNGVFVPFLNSLYGKNELEQFKKMIHYSFSIVGFVSIPLIIVCVIFAPEIIRITAGAGYEPAILPFRIVIFQVFFIGLAQILENQILLSLKKFKEVLVCTSVCTLLSVIILLSFTAKYGEVAAAYAVAVPHVLESVLLYHYAKKSLHFTFPSKEYLYHLSVCVPIVMLCLALKQWCPNYIMSLVLGCGISMVYYFLIEYHVVRQEMVTSQIDNVLHKAHALFRNK